jgi:hypothetical protein
LLPEWRLRLGNPEDTGSHPFIEGRSCGEVSEALYDFFVARRFVLEQCGDVSEEDVTPTARFVSLLG